MPQFLIFYSKKCVKIFSTLLRSSHLDLKITVFIFILWFLNFTQCDICEIGYFLHHNVCLQWHPSCHTCDSYEKWNSWRDEMIQGKFYPKNRPERTLRVEWVRKWILLFKISWKVPKLRRQLKCTVSSSKSLLWLWTWRIFQSRQHGMCQWV